MGSLPSRLRLLGVVHPGSAAGGATSAIRADFQDYLKLFAPAWVAQLAPAPLTPAERAAADQL